MLNEIQSAIITALNVNGRHVEAHGANLLDPAYLQTFPAVLVALDQLELKQANQKVWRSNVRVNVAAVIKNTGSEAVRRESINPLIESVLQSLVGQKLGLEIAPLQALAASNITTPELAQASLMAYLIEFSTSFDIKQAAEGTDPAFQRIGLNYLLQEPADTTVDAAEIIPIP